MVSLFKSATPETDTETKILKAALHLFAQRGYSGTTTKDLAQSAGGGRGYTVSPL